MEKPFKPSEDEGAALALQKGLQDLHQGLQWELERLEALLGIPQQERGKTVAANDFAEGPLARSGVLGASKRAPSHGLPHSPTELPPPPDAGGKPEPPPFFQSTVPQVPSLPKQGRVPSKHALEEGCVAATSQSARVASPFKFITQGLESVPEGDGTFYRNHGTALSGDLTHYKRTWEMERRKQELLKSKSEIAREPKKPSQILKDTAYHHYFETAFAVAILSSAVVYGAEVQYHAHHPRESEPIGFFIMHQVFTVLFLTELVIRMYSVGINTFLWGKDQWAWGWLDVLVSAASVLESVFGTYLLLSADGGQVVDTDPVRIMRMARVLRVSRAFRLQRFMWYIGSLRTLVYSIAATLRSLFWSMVLLLTIIFVFAMSFTQFTIDFNIDPDADPVVVREMSEYWGTLDRSMLTLFQSIAGGLSWREAALPMAEVSPFLVILFVVYISFVMFAVLNVVTGVFCSSAIETTSHTPDLVARSLIDNQHVYEEELRRLFHTIDAGDTGLITLSEFESLQGDEMALAYFRALEIDFEDAWSIFKLIDKDKGGAIEIDEFVRGCQQLRGGASSVEIKELAFDLKRLSEYMHSAVDKTEERFEQLASEVRSISSTDPRATKRFGSAFLA